MAFGGLKGTLVGSAASITDPAVCTGSVSVVIGDLVIAVCGQQTALTVIGCTDNLGNTYTAQNAGTDGGVPTGRMFYSRVTIAGTLTTINFDTTASANDWAGLTAVLEGPVKVSPIDKNLANIVSDITSPFTCPATGTLTQADEIIIGWGAANQSTVWTATSPNLLAGNRNSSTNIKVAIGYQAVAVTTTVSPVFAAAANPTACILSTASFMKDATQTLTPSLFTDSQTFYAPTVTTGSVTLTPGLITNNQTFYSPTVTQSGSEELFPSLVTNTQTFYAPVVTSVYNITSNLSTNEQSFFSSVVSSIYTLASGLVTNTSNFFVPVVTSVYTLSSGLATNISTFFNPAVNSIHHLTPDLFINTNTFFSAELTNDEEEYNSNSWTPKHGCQVLTPYGGRFKRAGAY